MKMDFEKIKELMKDDVFLFDFDSLPSDKKEKWLKGYGDKFNPKPKPDFDEYGLRFDTEYLRTLGNNILLIPVKYMAEYVDVITKGYVDKNDEVFIDVIKHDSDFVKEELNNMNATSCGNMAYTYLHTKDNDVKEYMKRNIRNLSIWKVEEMIEYFKQMQN